MVGITPGLYAARKHKACRPAPAGAQGQPADSSE
jgi:hypothetical protein